MSDRKEVSSGGVPTDPHTPQQAGTSSAPADALELKKLEAHINRHLPGEMVVFHEPVSSQLHIDIYIKKPTAERNFYTLITSGMSSKPIKAAASTPNLNYAELMLCLPAKWNLTASGLKDEGNFWPIRWLRLLGRMPHEYHTRLWVSHTIPNGDPVKPFAANTKLCCMFLSVPTLCPDGFIRLDLDEKKTIFFLSVIPIYKEEMELKLNEGGNSLAQALEAANVNELIDINRRNACAKKLGLF